MSVSNHPIAPYVRGAMSLVEGPDGLVIAQRFFPKQLEHLASVGRDKRASSTAGVVLDFATDGTEVSLDCRVMRGLDANHPIYQAVMGGEVTGKKPYGLAEEGNVDGIDFVVDGRLVATVAAATTTLRLAFENPNHEELEVRIYLPTIMNIAFGNLQTNGSLKPLPQRGYLLAFGDSITQGFVCGQPSLSYPAQIASTLGLDLVNQAVAGHTFDEDVLGGSSLWRVDPPEVVTVAYGTNDWSRKRSAEAIEGDASAFLERVHRMFPNVPTYVLSPLWRADEHESMPCGRPLTWMHQMLCRVCSRYDNMRVIDGYHGIPKDPTLFADGSLHPGAECMGLVADIMLEAICADSVDLIVRRHVDKRMGRAFAADEFVSREARIDHVTSLRDGSPETHPQFDRLVRTIWRLRQPDGCPWDREQTHQSLAKHMVEEAYEAAEAMREGDADHLREEMGDVLEQVLLNAQIAYEEWTFNIDDVCRELNEKLIRRHPHVFGELDEPERPSNSEEVLQIWDDVKRQERAEDGRRPGLLDSVPVSLPALMQAQKISKRAAKAGFEWDTVADIWDKVAEEREEFEQEPAGSDRAVEEFGDMLFALVNVARRCGIDAEEALARSNAKFRRRWAAMEAHAELEGMSTAALNELWDSVKSEE